MVKRNQSKHADEDEQNTSMMKKSSTHRKRGRGKSTRMGKGRSRAKRTSNKKGKRTAHKRTARKGGRRAKHDPNHVETDPHLDQ